MEKLDLMVGLTFAIREEAMARSKGWDGIADDWVTMRKKYEEKLKEHADEDGVLTVERL